MSPTRALGENHFPAGTHLVLLLIDGTFHSLQVIEAFQPFTKSQVFLVRPEPASRGLPLELVLKIFDPRYLDNRALPKVLKPGSRLRHPWTLEGEIEAARYRQEVAEGERPEHDEFLEDRLEEPDQEAEPYLWEEHYYRVMKDCWESENDAFSLLKSFQGTVIPRFYGSGNVSPRDTRVIQPFAILMEYIHGTTLEKIDPGKVKIPPALFYPMLDATKAFPDLGVCHTDIKGNNILLSPSNAPTRAVLIDFGCALIRGDRSDARWLTNVNFYRDERRLRVVLSQKGIIRLDG
ncbi:hypothetical protein M413DRAFT_77002 [Hebeloma cylindrosporum]|uniref:Protein kinase domain-containing protein n=1 Tax=Hebeloma cylindrosporum TaxID=76867 RepID=A0A0C3C076_HEBCY|nr:hypothetical protein M413DRAFT_77002 [Hebeloma cylindrosporum h7]